MPHRKRILLSDDNEGFSTLLLESLHEHGGFHVLHAREEHEVMETIQCHKPHILLLDDMLPHKGGLHVLRAEHYIKDAKEILAKILKVNAKEIILRPAVQKVTIWRSLEQQKQTKEEEII